MSAVSRRLQVIAEMVSGEVIADIGCDHAYVCILALKSGKTKKAYACDIRPGPLRNAQKNAAQYGLEPQMEFRLQNGVENLPHDVSQIVISGMGGTLISEILSQLDPFFVLRKQGISLLLSPHKDADALRRWLYENGFCIQQEQWVEDGHFYPVLEVCSTAQSLPVPSQAQLLYGVHPKEDAVYWRMLEKSRDKWKRLAAQMPPMSRSRAEKKADLAAELLLHSKVISNQQLLEQPALVRKPESDQSES